MTSEDTKFCGVFEIGSECVLVGIGVSCCEEEDFLVGLNAECFERDDDGNILMNRVVTEVNFTLLCRDICFRFQPSMGRPGLNSISFINKKWG